jgi:Tol biopolymer transport system component
LISGSSTSPRGTNTRLTSGPGSEVEALWSPAGDRVLYRANPDGKFSIYSKDAGGVGREELIAKMEQSIGGSERLVRCEQ